jgi:hypothetical protein
MLIVRNSLLFHACRYPGTWIADVKTFHTLSHDRPGRSRLQKSANRSPGPAPL